MSTAQPPSAAPVILVAGGCGYIGTHTVVVLLQKGYNVVVVDNLVNSSSKSLDAVCQIVGLTAEQRQERLVFYNVDICQEAPMRKIFEESPTFAACIHFAGLKVGGRRHKKKDEDSFLQLTYYCVARRPSGKALAFPFATMRIISLVPLSCSICWTSLTATRLSFRHRPQSMATSKPCQ